MDIGHSSGVVIRDCQAHDLTAVCRLLKDNELPYEDISLDKIQVLLATEEHNLVGCIGLELYPPHGLLRSFAVSERYRNKGVGAKLYQHFLELCRKHGIKTLHLLTFTASEYFELRGFTISNRKEAPASIQQTSEFSELCPDSCTYLRSQISGLRS